MQQLTLACMITVNQCVTWQFIADAVFILMELMVLEIYLNI